MAEEVGSPLESPLPVSILPDTAALQATSLTELRNICAQTAAIKQQEILQYNPTGKIHVDLGKSVIPASFAKCPSQQEVQSQVLADKFHVSVLDLKGYDFSSEFTNVYKARGGKESRYNDFKSMCCRALTVSDSSLSEADVATYCTYIMLVAKWELALCHPIASDTLSKHFSSLQLTTSATATLAGTKFSPLRIYIGKSRANIVVWIRVNIAIVKTEESQKKKVESDPSLAADKRKEEQLLKSTYAMYYRKYILSPNVCNAFVAASIPPPIDPKTGKPVKAAPVPPPPRIGPDDIRIYLSFPQAVATSKSPIPSDAVRTPRNGEVRDATNIVDENEDTEDDFQGALLIKHNAAATAAAATTASAFTAKSSIDNPFLRNASPCCELYGWGHNMYASLGCGSADEEYVSDPRSIPLSAFVPLERVRMIACSPRHTLLLTQLGTVFGCGDNTEGCLGLGDTLPRPFFCQLQWSLNGTNQTEPPTIVCVAAGSGSIGSHSCAIDKKGNLYSWGVGYCTGLGETKAVLTPRLVNTFLRTNVLSDEQNAEAEAQDDQDDATAEGRALGTDTRSRLYVAAKCAMVACGGGFTVCILRSGLVFSWGMWSHGRLGLGPTPTLDTSGSMRSGRAFNSSSSKKQKKVARYQLRPALIRGINNAVSVSCGEAHSLLLLKSGDVLVWGQNSCGQLGSGPNVSGYLVDLDVPAALLPFANNDHYSSNSIANDINHGYDNSFNPTQSNDYHISNYRPVRAAAVCCGSFHSVVIDSAGSVWSWGARGSACLGHYDAALVGEWNERVTNLFVSATGSNRVMVPYELLPWVRTWSRPRLLEATLGLRVLQVSAGDMHTAFLTDSGEVLFAGSGTCVPPYLSSETVQRYQGTDDDEEEGEDDEEDNSKQANHDQDKKAKKKKSNRGELTNEEIQEMMSHSIIVSSPRRPSASWLTTLTLRSSIYLASAGSRIFVLQDCESIVPSLMDSLLHRLVHGDPSDGDNDDGSVSTARTSIGQFHDAKSIGSYFERRGKSDCMIVAGGKVLLAHRAILCQRSSELRDMIEAELPDNYSIDTRSNSSIHSNSNSNYDDQQPVQILLPHLHLESARALLQYLYTDMLPLSVVADISILNSLAKVGETLRMPRLQLLCESYLRALATFKELVKAERETEVLHSISKGNSSSSSSVDIFSPPTPMIEIPPCTLGRDLGALVGDKQFADVRFIAEGRAICAHRFILESRSEYFRAMFRSGQTAETAKSKRKASTISRRVVDVVVPDTFVGFLRLLIFLYTNTLPDGSDGALLEDLMSAERYHLDDMKLLCESMLVPSATNWLDLLRAADVLGTHRLHAQTVGFLRDHFDLLLEVVDEEGYQEGYNHEDDEEDAEGRSMDASSAAGKSKASGTTTTAAASNTSNSLQTAKSHLSASSGISNSKKKEGRTGIAIIEEEFPGLLARIVAMREEIYPKPPSKLYIDRLAQHSTEAAEAVKRVPFPYLALLVGIMALLVYHYTNNVVIFSPYVPYFNAVCIVLGILFLLNYHK